jgi:hypothetical protein
MELARIDINEGATEYDAKRHRLREGSIANGAGDLFRVIVSTVYKTGYIDLTTAQPVRKAVVKTKMLPK